MSKSVVLPEEFDYDVWVTKFVYELHEFFGLPLDPSDCHTKSDKMQFLWARIGISNAMNKLDETWRSMRGKVSPKIAAEEFARRYYNKYGKLVVEDVPDFFMNAGTFARTTNNNLKLEDRRIETSKKN